MTATSRSFRFARGVSWSLLGQVALAALNFFLTPYLVERMGVEAYGLYLLLHTTAAYLSLLALGSGAAAVKHVAAYAAKGEGRGLRDTLRYAALTPAAGALLGAALLAAGAAPLALRLFRVPPQQAGLAAFLLLCAAAGALPAALTQAASAVLQGLQRFDLQAAVALLQNGAFLLGAAGLLAAGSGVREVGAWYVALNAGVCVIALALAWRSARPAAAAPQGRGLAYKAFASWGLSQWWAQVAGTVIYQFDRLFIVRAISLSDLTLYAVPAGLLQRLQVLPATIATVVSPLLIEADGHGDAEAFTRIYLRTVRFLLWAVLPVLVLLFSLMPQFLTLWLGGEFSEASVWPMRALVVAQFFFLLNVMPGAVAFSRDRPWHITASAWLHAGLSLLLWKLLIGPLGLLGVALGALAAQAVPTILLSAYVHRRVLGITLARFVEEGLFLPCASAALLLALVFPLHAHATGWARLIALGSAGAAVFYGSTWLLLGKDDREAFRSYLRLKG